MSAAKPLPTEAIAYLGEHGQPVAYPAGAISRRWNEPTVPTATHAVHWAQQARQDIAEHGIDWADGHVSGLELAAVAEGAWNGQLSTLAAEYQGRPDPLAAYSEAWVRDENAAERAAMESARGAFPTAAAAVDRPTLEMPKPAAKSVMAPAKVLGRSA